MKTCIKCNNQKPIQDFPTYKSRTPGAALLHKNYCKTCKNSYTIIQCVCGKPKHKKSELCEDCRKLTYIKDHKICPACKIEKPYTAYHMRKEKGGYSVPKSYCKECEVIRKKISMQVKINPTECTCYCGEPKSKRSDNCQNCKWAEFSQKTLGEVLIITGPKFQRYHNIRKIACKFIQQNNTCCIRCGYSKHFEACHIKAISSFSLDTKIALINSPDNLIALCRNCHWELDNGHTTIEQIKSSSN